MLVALFVLAAGLEIIGVLAVLHGFRKDRARVKQLGSDLKALETEPRRPGGRASPLPLELEVENTAQNKRLQVLVAAWADQTGGSLWRLIGPVAIIVGIAVGMAANIAALP